MIGRDRRRHRKGKERKRTEDCSMESTVGKGEYKRLSLHQLKLKWSEIDPLSRFIFSAPLLRQRKLAQPPSHIESSGQKIAQDPISSQTHKSPQFSFLSLHHVPSGHIPIPIRDQNPTPLSKFRLLLFPPQETSQVPTGSYLNHSRGNFCFPRSPET